MDNLSLTCSRAMPGQGQSQSITKVNVLCGGANLGITSGGYEVKYIESVFMNCAPRCSPQPHPSANSAAASLDHQQI